MKKTEVPIVLSGGGARGFAHLGVLKALEEANIFPSAIAATSAGALVGAFIADGYKSDEVKALIMSNVNLGYLFDFKHFRSNLVTLNIMGDFIRKHLRHTQIEDLPIPFYPTATNFMDGSQHVFKYGDIVEASLAACSLPAVFPPRIIDNIPFVDGGLANNLPIEPFGDRKAEVIAIHVNPVAPFNPNITVPQVLERAFHLGFMHTIRASAHGCLLFVEPPGLYKYGLFDIHKFQEIYEAGYSYTRQLLKIKGFENGLN
jgi:NTE family protein